MVTLNNTFNPEGRLRRATNEPGYPVQEIQISEAGYIADVNIRVRKQAEGSELRKFADASCAAVNIGEQIRLADNSENRDSQLYIWKKMKLNRFVLTFFLLLTGGLALAGQDELVQAIIHGADAKQVAEMLQQGADANKPEAMGRTPLMAAAFSGTPEVVKLLLTKGADVNAKGLLGVTALVNATNRNSPEIVKLLLDKGANPNVKVLDAPLLQLAAAQCTAEIIQMLLEKGAEVNATDSKGDTALMAAAESGNLDVARVLLKDGADRALKNSDGKTALYMAKQNKHKEVVKLLESNRN